MENPIKMDDLGVPLFSETSISSKVYTKSVRRFFQPQEPDFATFAHFFETSYYVPPYCASSKMQVPVWYEKKNKSWEVVVVHIDRTYPYQ